MPSLPRFLTALLVAAAGTGALAAAASADSIVYVKVGDALAVGRHARPAYVNDDVYGNSAVQQPTMRCGLDKGLVVNPTWSQDSGSVAYGSSDGIHVMSVPADFNCNATADRLLVAGG